MKLIVGLGNPGPQYARTRHNVGFRVVDRFAQRVGTEMSREKFHAWFGDAVVDNERVVLLKPTTFMNRSGQAVLAAGRFHRIELSDLLVITDDTALELGRLRMRQKGSAGGHNGLGDIITRLGCDEFCRLRLGIGQPRGNRVAYVLDPFAPDEEPVVEAMIDRAADGVRRWIADGASLAMNVINLPLPEADAGNEKD